MPYINIQNQDYENTLYLYTIGLRNGRYDIIDTKGIDSKYSNNATSLHSFDQIINSYNKYIISKIDSLEKNKSNKSGNENSETNQDDNKIDPDTYKISKYYYNTYNTYRKFISLDTSLLKLNETTITLSLLNDNMYNIDYDSSTNVYNLFDFKGIALNYYYPLNGRMATLEDIFAEYFYDYIVAIDLLNEAEGKDYYYFDKNLSYSLLFSYSIIPIGNTYKDEETDEEEIILYDGTTVPTVYDIILGNLYIIFKSGNMPARKIYFNNAYGPSLFVNDDKYNIKYLGLTNTDSYQYILNDNQPAKLCDITRFRSWGYKLLFPASDTPNPFITITTPKITPNNILLRIDAYALLITRGNNANVISMVIGNDLTTGINKKNVLTSDNILFSSTLFSIPLKSLTDPEKKEPVIDSSIWDTQSGFPFGNNKTMGNVLRPKSTNESTSFIFGMIPYIALLGYSITSYEELDTDDGKTLIINVTKSSTNELVSVPFNFVSCALNTSGNVLDSTLTLSNNTDIATMYDKDSDTSVLIYKTINIDSENVNTVNKFSDLLMESGGLTQSAFVSEIKQNDSNIYGLLLKNIPFKDLTTYDMSNILQVTIPNISINELSIEPGFFTKDEEYLPAYMEYIDEEEIPIFIEL